MPDLSLRRVGCWFPLRRQRLDHSPPSYPPVPVILEGLVTTVTADGSLHLAAMGPEVSNPAAIDRLILKPFAGSRTAELLATHPEGVFHLTDDVLLLAQAVTGTLSVPPDARPAKLVRGWVLEGVCEAFEFRINEADRSAQRARLEAVVVQSHHGRPFRGFNRAAHAVVEAAIFFSRLHLLGPAEVSRQFESLRPLIEKTGGPREHDAFSLLVHQAATQRPS